MFQLRVKNLLKIGGFERRTGNFCLRIKEDKLFGSDLYYRRKLATITIRTSRSAPEDVPASPNTSHAAAVMTLSAVMGKPGILRETLR